MSHSLSHTLSHYQKNIGFTLIELLVVLVILGITTSLVAPDMFAIVKRSQAKTELEKIKAIAELSVERSYFSASNITIEFKDNGVVFYQVTDGEIKPEKQILKAIESDVFIFESAKVAIVKGSLQGNPLIKITKSPDNNLNEFFLFDMPESIFSQVLTETVEDGSIIDSQVGYSE